VLLYRLLGIATGLLEVVFFEIVHARNLRAGRRRTFDGEPFLLGGGGEIVAG
jgi:hypothetical protein